MRDVPIVAVDPGGAQTGIVAVTHDGLARWALITRTTALDSYLREVTEAVVELRNHARILLVEDDFNDFRNPIIAVEDINDPTPKMGMVAVRGLLDTAQVLGAVAIRFTIIRIPPGGHGQGLLAAYPEALRGDREKVGTGKLRHVRAAYDIAAHAATLIRQGASA